MLKPLLKKAIPIIAMIPLLGACSPFQPKTKVIEYDEEVKLHDGSMIWVHIKRHYERSNGREISNWFQGYEKGWGAKEVEISWDTGFPNVGRKSVSFENPLVIETFGDNWYLYGAGLNNSYNVENNCVRFGLLIGKYKGGCLLGIDRNGNFFQPTENILYQMSVNILYPNYINDWGQLPEPLNGKNLSWQEKINLQDSQPPKYRFITGKQYTKEQFQ